MTRPSSNGHHVQHGLYGDSAQPQSNGFSGGQGTEPPNRKIYNHKSNNPKNHTDCVRGQMTINGHATPMPPPQRRLLILENAKEFSDRLYAQPCRLDLLMCAIWFRKMPYKEKPSEQDLKALIDKFDEIVLNTIPDRLNPIMLAQWSCLLTKCEMSENNLKNLLQLTTKLIKQLKNWKFQQIGQVLYNLRNLLNSTDSDALMFALSQEIETAELLDSQAIGNGLYGLQKMTSSDATDAVLSSLARHIWLSKQPLFPGHIAMALYGLQNMTCSDATDAVLWALQPSIRDGGILNSKEISMAFYGLQKMARSTATDAVLCSLAEHIKKNSLLDSQAIGNILYGMQNMTCSDASYSVLSALLPHIQNMNSLDTQTISNGLYGLQNMRSSKATQAFLHKLLPHIQQAAQLSSQQIGMAVYGLKNMNSDDAVNAVLFALTRHIEFPKQRLEPQNICMALYGLQNMTTSDATDVVLWALESHIRDEAALSPQEIGMALYGLQNMTNSNATEALLDALSPHIRKAAQLSRSHISMALYGLQNMISSNATETLLQALLPHIEKAAQLSPQQIGMVLYGLQNLTRSDATDAVLFQMARQIEFSGEYLQPKSMSMALRGLQNMHHSDATDTLLRVLELHIPENKIFNPEGLLSTASIFIAEVICSLHNQLNHKVAQSFIKRLSEYVMGNSLTIPLNDPQIYRSLLWQVLGSSENVKRQSSDEITTIDLHGMSFALAKDFLAFALERLLLLENKASIVFGSSSHNQMNSGKMQQQVVRVLKDLSDRKYPIAYEFHPEKPYVMVNYIERPSSLPKRLRPTGRAHSVELPSKKQNTMP